MKLKILFFFFVLIYRALYVQGQGVVVFSGQVVDEKNAPVSYATVRLELQSNKVVANTTQTDSAGHFEFYSVLPGTYLIRLNYLGFIPYTSAPLLTDGIVVLPTVRIILAPDTHALQEVLVTANHPLVERLLDKTVVNVEGSSIATGNNALDLLTLSPGIILTNGRLVLNGKSGVTVLIDNKPTYLSYEQLSTYLKSINATEVKQIEIITNPSSRYDAQGTGGVINIVMKKATVMGLQATFFSGAGYGYFPRYNAGASLSYRQGRLSTFGSYSFSRTNQHEQVTGSRDLLTTQTHLVQNNTIKVAGTSHFLRSGVDYQFNSKNLVGVQLKATLYQEAIPQLNNTTKNYPTSTNDSSFVTAINSTNSLKNISVNINHTINIDSTSKRLTTSLDFAKFNIASQSTYQTMRAALYPTSLAAMSSLFSDLPYSTSIYTGRLDYTQNFSAVLKFEAGVKTSHVSTDNSLKYFNTTRGLLEMDDRLSNEFAYTENIHAAYASLRKQGKRLGMQIGLRGEYTSTKGESSTLSNSVSREYINLFPSLFASYALSSTKQISLTYSRRIERPLYKDLNPFTYYIDPFSSLQGNPYLRPQYAHAFEVTYLLNQKISFTSSYTHTSDVIIQVPEPVPGTNAYVLKKDNVSIFNNFGLLISYPIVIKKSISSNVSLNLYRSIYSSQFQGDDLNNSRSTAELNVSSQIILPKEVILEFSGYYLSPFVQGYYRTAAIATANAGLKRSFYDKNLSVKLTINDLFNSYRVINDAFFADQQLHLEQRFNTRFFNASLTYKISRGAKISATRKVEGNQEEQKRVK